MTTAAIPERVAAVAVEENFDGSPVADVIIAAVKGCAVIAFDENIFAGKPLHDAADPVQVFCYGFVSSTLKRFVRGGMFVDRGIEADPVNIAACSQHNDEDREYQIPEHIDHLGSIV